MIKNIFITGRPGCGKTTLIMEILRGIDLSVGGFYTAEIREKGMRKGFKIITIDGKEGILAHQNIKSPYKVSKYGVNIKDLEKIVVKAVLGALKRDKICIIDEIGKMELFSEKFKKAVLTALDSKNKVLGTIKLTPDPFTDKIKKRKDTKVFYLTRENREEIKEKLKQLLKSYGNYQQNP
ncbi:MAG: NTPase [Patescibacteria group bacterium]